MQIFIWRECHRAWARSQRSLGVRPRVTQNLTFLGEWAQRMQRTVSLGRGAGSLQSNCLEPFRPVPHYLLSCSRCCSGLGYVLGSTVAELTGNWRWALRVSFTSFLSLRLPPGPTGTFQTPAGLRHLASYLTPWGVGWGCWLLSHWGLMGNAGYGN